MSELHILNGDCALALWKKCNFSADALVWKETYLEGPLVQTDDLHIFRKARAEFLSTLAELEGVEISALCKHLKQMDDALTELPEKGELMLWFDACIFDQTILMRILYLLGCKENTIPEIYLYCCQNNCLDADDFKRGKTERIHLERKDLKAAAKAWNAFAEKDAEKMRQLAYTEDFSHLPAMQKALLRCAEEVPDASGLNRTQRQIMQIISKESCTFKEIFKKLSDFEELPFLGDTACLRILNELEKQGLTERIQNGCYQTLQER